MARKRLAWSKQLMGVAPAGPALLVSVLRAGIARGLLRRQCRHGGAAQFRLFLV